MLQCVKFQLVLILGDSLGLNSIFGLVVSFKANHFYRICKISFEVSAILTVEDESLSINPKNYDEDAKKADPKVTGIEKSCVFNKITNFHTTQNLIVDMIHGLLEDVCLHVMQSIIYSLIFELHYFTLEALNTRIQNFDYGSVENCNIPIISENNVLKKKCI